jgi:integrase
VTRRGRHEGSIRQRSDGRWEARVTIGYRDSKRVHRSFYGLTRRAVQEQMIAAQRELQTGVVALGPSQTVATFLESWLEQTAKPTLRPRTHLRYVQLVRKHALPTLGAIALRKLTPQHLATLYGRKFDEGLSPRSVQFLHAVLHRAFKQAVRWQLIGRNPADAVDAPKPRRPEIRPLSPLEARQLLEAARGDNFEALYVLSLTTGMRQGEVLGLTWAAIDLDAGRLEVRATLQRLPGSWSLEEPKTGKSRRSIRLAPVAVRALRAQRARQAEQRLRLGSAWPNHDLVFTNGWGEPLDGRHLPDRFLRPLLKKAGLPTIRWHDLRHSFATLALTQGVHPKVVQEMLGHSSVSLTLDVYSHVLPNLQEEAAASMERVLGAATQ